ncbi:TPA: hypothetical protein ACPJ13_000136 [Vibrio alginolyticus]
MTKNIEERTLAATATLELSAKTVDEIAHQDKDVPTPVGNRKSFPKISREADERFLIQQNRHNEEFQHRWSISQQAIPWVAGVLISDSLQRYSVGVLGQESYKEFLPSIDKLPFTTKSSFEEDIELGFWVENGVPSKDWVGKYADEKSFYDWPDFDINNPEKNIAVPYRLYGFGSSTNRVIFYTDKINVPLAEVPNVGDFKQIKEYHEITYGDLINSNLNKIVGLKVKLVDRDYACCVLSENGDESGIYLGVTSSGTKIKLRHKNKLKTSWFGSGVSAYKLAMNAAVSHDLDLSITETVYKVNETFIIGDDSGKEYNGKIDCDLYIEPLVPLETLTQIKNCRGSIGNVWSNAIDICDFALEIDGCAGLEHKLLRGRRGKRWGVLMNGVSLNNNSLIGTSIRGENSGHRLDTSFTHISVEGSATPSQRSTLVLADEIPDHQLVFQVGNNDFFITDKEADNKTIKVYPAIPENLRTVGSCSVFCGGGVKYVGADSGVNDVSKLVCQANKGVGVWFSSLYGQSIGTGVFELNSGPDIVIGSSTTSFSAKNLITTGYFESSKLSSYILMLSPNSRLSILDAFNLKNGKVRNLYDFIIGGRNRKQVITVFDDDHEILRHPFDFTFDVAAQLSIDVEQAESQFLSSSSSTSDFSLNLKAINDKHRDTKTEIHITNFNNRDMVIRDSDGGLINGELEIRLLKPGSGVIYAFRDSYSSDNVWKVTFIKSSI